MKKVIITFIACLMLVGCTSSAKSDSYMIKNSKNKYNLVSNQKVINKTNYDKYEKVDDNFLVTKDKEVSLVAASGKVVIDSKKYSKLKALDSVYSGYDKDKKLTIFNSDGTKVYQEDKNTKIKLSPLPIIYNKKNKKYTILTAVGDKLKTTKTEIIGYSRYEGSLYAINYKNKTTIYNLTDDSEVVTTSLKGKYALMDYSKKFGYVFYNKDKQKYAYVNIKGKVIDERELELTNIYFRNTSIVGEKDEEVYLISLENKVPVVANSYYLNYSNYTAKSQFVYTHNFIYRDKEKEVTDIQLNPEIVYTSTEVFPVYKKSKGFQYYNYAGKQEFKGTYDEAAPYDENERAIVSQNKKYYLIDNKGNKKTKGYKDIKYLNDQYYQVFTSTSQYNVVDKNGKKVLDESFMGDACVFVVDESVYGMFDKSGTTYVYNITENDELFSKSGTFKYDEVQNIIYKTNNKAYYTIDGELIYKRSK